MAMTHLPNELLLALFSEFHLTSLTIARGVCRKWRNLLELAQIHPVRKTLLDIYLQIIPEPWFLEGRPWVLDNLVQFDREAYVHAILAQYHYLPEDFRIWILEWPAKAVVGGIWPGLPETIRDDVGPIGSGRSGWNLMNWEKPLVCTVKHINDDSDVNVDDDEQLVEPLPGLPLFHEQGNYGVWLLLDTGRYRDQVLSASDGDEFFASDGPEVYVVRWPSWLNYFKTYEVQIHRYRYERLKSCGEVKSGVWTCPDEYRIQFVPWSAEQKPYRRRIE